MLLVVAAITRLIFSFDRQRPDASACLREMIYGSGLVVREPERKEGGQVFVVRVKEMFANELIRCVDGELNIRMKTKLYPRFAYGDSVSFSGRLSELFNFFSGGGRSFNYRGFLAKDSIYYEIKSGTAQIYKMGNTDSGNTGSDAASSSGSDVDLPQTRSLAKALYSLKRRFVTNLEHALGEPHAALAAGLVVGEKSALGKDLLEDFRIVGLIHIVVLSGYNITIVADSLRRILSFLPRTWGILAGGAGIALFGILVGGGATVVRSCFMAGVAITADLIRRDYSVHRALAFAALVMLIHNPLILLNDPSFQLSFLATLALVLFAAPFEKLLPFISEKFGMRGIVATTTATQIFVAPFILHMMGQISIIGLVVNILVLPLIPLTMLAVFLTGAAGSIFAPVGPLLAQGIGWFSHALLSYELFIVEKFSDIPYAAVEVPKFSGWLVVLAYAVMMTGYVVWVRRMRGK